MTEQLPPRWRYRKGFYWYRVPPGLEALWEDCQEYPLGKTKEQAWDTWLRKLGETQPAAVVTIGDMFDWLLVHQIPQMAPKLATIYLTAIKRLRPIFGHMRMDEVRPEHTSEYLDLMARRQWRNQGPGLPGARNDLDMLTNALSQAVLSGFTKDNPLLDLRKPKPRIRRKYIEPWELGELMLMGQDMTVDPRRRRSLVIGKCYTIIKLMTGASRRDILSIRLNDITTKGLRVAGELEPWDADGILRKAIDVMATQSPTQREPYVIVNRKGAPYLIDGEPSTAFSSLWKRFVADAVRTTGIKTPFQEMHLVAAHDDLAAIANALNFPTTPQNFTDSDES